MARISIATTANCHDYKASQLSYDAGECRAGGSNNEGGEGGRVPVPAGARGRPTGLLLDRPLLAINLI